MAADGFTASLLRASARGFAGLAAGRLAEDAPEVVEAFGFEAWRAHLTSQVEQLAAAVEDGLPRRFADHAAWSRAAFAARDVPVEALGRGLEHLRAVLEESLPEETRAVLAPFFEAAGSLTDAPPDLASALSRDDPHGALALDYLAALHAGDERGAQALVLETVDAGRVTVEDALERVLAGAQREVGRLWHLGEVNIAQEHFVTAATRRAVVRLLERATSAAPNGRTVLVSSVAGDAHDVGVHLVSSFFELAGWRAICLGADTPGADLVAALEAYAVDLVALGATLDTQRRGVAEAIRSLRAARPELKVIVGGTAFAGDDGLWRRAGADGYAGSPREAVQLGGELLGPA